MRFLETFKMALAALATNKLRSFLTLVGIIAGVASIIAVMTGISVVQKTMEKELSVLGSTVFQVQKWPAGGFNNEADWRKIQQRKPVTVAHADAIREQAKHVSMVGSELWSHGLSARYKGKPTDPDLTICGGTPEYPANNTHYVEFGRNLNQQDLRLGRHVVVIGYAAAERLFPFTDPLGKTIKLDGRKYQVVGIFEQRLSAMGASFDTYMLIPITAFLKLYGMRQSDGSDRSVNVTVRARSPEVMQDAIEETRAILRVERGVPPREEDDFTIFTSDSMIRSFNQATAGVKVGAFIIGAIALLVAGIGIMNIMLVSVTERTSEIGIRKSIGARRKHILGQFLVEAILLCNVGGVFGVLVGFGLGNSVTLFTDFEADVPLEWAVAGLVFCTAVGLSFGLWPAIKASKLHPIDALGYE